MCTFNSYGYRWKCRHMLIFVYKIIDGRGNVNCIINKTDRIKLYRVFGLLFNLPTHLSTTLINASIAATHSVNLNASGWTINVFPVTRINDCQESMKEWNKNFNQAKETNRYVFNKIFVITIYIWVTNAFSTASITENKYRTTMLETEFHHWNYRKLSKWPVHVTFIRNFELFFFFFS